MKGVIKWFGSRGYGFLTGEDGNDYFVHHRQIDMPGYRVLREGQAVDFEPLEGPKGLQATAVRPLL